MRSFRTIWIILACIVNSFSTAAQAPRSIEGDFIQRRSLMDSEGGYDAVDSIHLSFTPSGKLRFYFDTFFPYHHLCGMEGEATKVGDHYEYQEKQEDGTICILKIIHEEPRIILEDAGFFCRGTYCGVRGRIQGSTFYRSTWSGK